MPRSVSCLALLMVAAAGCTHDPAISCSATGSQCAMDADCCSCGICQAGKCAPAAGLCHPQGGSCQSASDCTGGLTCHFGKCEMPVQAEGFCDLNSDCATDLVCVDQSCVKPAARLSWSTKASMPTLRYDLGLAAQNGKLYAIGGYSGSILDIVEQYDPATDTWTTRAPMPTARRSLAVVAADNGRIYAIGGLESEDPNATLSLKNEEYDPVSDSWTARAPVPAAGKTCIRTAAAFTNGSIYVWQGRCFSGSPATLLVYDPQGDAWTTGADLPGSILVIEPVLVSQAPATLFALLEESAVDEFDATKSLWTVRPTVRDAKPVGNTPSYSMLAATPFRLYAIGFQDADGSPNTLTSQVRYFDDASSSWLPATAPPTAREWGATAVIGSTIYIAGGYQASNLSGPGAPLGTFEACVETL